MQAAAAAHDPAGAAKAARQAEKLLDADNPQAAISYLQQAVALDPTDAQYHADLGVTFGQLGRLREAAGELQEALRLGHPAKDQVCFLACS